MCFVHEQNLVYFCMYRQYMYCVYVLYAFCVLDVQKVLFKLFLCSPKLKFIHND